MLLISSNWISKGLIYSIEWRFFVILFNWEAFFFFCIIFNKRLWGKLLRGWLDRVKFAQTSLSNGLAWTDRSEILWTCTGLCHVSKNKVSNWARVSFGPHLGQKAASLWQPVNFASINFKTELYHLVRPYCKQSAKDCPK